MAQPIRALATLPIRPRPSSQNPHGSSQPPVNPAPGNPTPSSSLCRQCTHTIQKHACRQNIHKHKIKINKSLKEWSQETGPKTQQTLSLPVECFLQAIWEMKAGLLFWNRGVGDFITVLKYSSVLFTMNLRLKRLHMWMGKLMERVIIVDCY